MNEVPAQALPYVEVLGEDDALDFLLEFGGSPIYLPANPRGAGEVEKMIGSVATSELYQRLGHYVRVPTVKRWCARQLHKKQLPITKIARKLHVTDVTVRSYLAEHNPRQLGLFDALDDPSTNACE